MDAKDMQAVTGGWARGSAKIARPEPLVEIGGIPIIGHTMKTYSACGVNDFIVCRVL